ncbi:MAG: ABC transporter substrate-binding protein [Anaerolineae bacterium]
MKPRSALLAALVIALLAVRPHPLAGQEAITLTLATSEPARFQASAVRYMDANPDVTVRVLRVATDDLALYQQALAAHTPDIDLYDIEITWSGLFARHLFDIHAALPAEATGAFFPALIEAFTVDGRLVGLPYQIDAGVLYSRADLLAKYGYDAPPATWDALTAMAAAIQEGERAAGNAAFWGYVWQGERYEGLVCNALEWQFASGGGHILDASGQPEVNNAGTRAALARAAAWVGAISPPGVTTYVEEDARQVWRAGNAAFMRNWTYVAQDAAGSAGASDLIVSPLPAGDAGASGGCLRGRALAVSRYSPHLREAVALAAFLAGEREQRLRALEHAINPALPALYHDPDMLAVVPWLGQLEAAFTNPVARPANAAGAAYDAVARAYAAAIHAALTGEATPANAMARLEEELTDILHADTELEPTATPAD